jgi:hypothetical protein
MAEITKKPEDDDVDENLETSTDTDDQETGSEEEQSGDDILGLSDDEFEKQLSDLPAQSNVVAVEDESSTDDKDKEETTDEAVEDADVSGSSKKTSTKKAKTETVSKEEKKTEPGDDDNTPGFHELDDAAAASAFREIFKPFKANNKTVQVSSADEAIRLMQMGAGHVRYQNQVRPMLARAKTLENNNISDDDLNFLVELHNKNPEAIKKLVRDAQIDPYDITVDEESKAADSKYRPKNYLATEGEVTLDHTLADVRSIPEGVELLTSVRTEWDEESRATVVKDPNILRVLTGQKQSGIYKIITAEMDRRTMLGTLPKVPFIQAYHQIGLELNETGAFGSLESEPETKKAEPGKQPAGTSKVVAQRTGKPKSKANNNDKVKAIAPIKTVAPGKAPPQGSNVLDMSDDEFAKLDLQKFG